MEKDESIVVLPENGSVVIIDNQSEEALPILSALSKHGIATTYYKGNSQAELPKHPIQLVRLVFLDLQLIETSDENQIAKHVTNVLNSIISKKNGPYILVIWSKNYAKYGAAVQAEIKTLEHLIPVCILNFNKRDCLIEKTINKIDQDGFLDEVFEKLEGRFTDEDQLAIRESIVQALSNEFSVEYEAKPNAIEIIEQHLKSELQKAGVFHLFVLWENLIKKSSASSINGVSSSIEMNDLWEKNMRNVIFRMAKAQTGQNEISTETALKASLATLTYSFSEEIDSSVRDYKFPDYINLNNQFIFSAQNNSDTYGIQEFEDANEIKCKINKNGADLKYSVKGTEVIHSVKKKVFHNLSEGVTEPDKSVVKKMVYTFLSIPFHINTKLHIEINPAKDLTPGNVYIIDLEGGKKAQYLLTYFEKVTDLPIDQILFIELEISPICDYAQTKWKKSRLVSGIIYPSNLIPKSQGDHLFRVQPTFLIDNKPCKIIFDFHLFKSLDLDVVKARNIKFKLKRELLLDIIANLSGHVNRPGIAFVQ